MSNYSNISSVSHDEQNSYLEISLNAKLNSKEMSFLEVQKIINK